MHELRGESWRGPEPTELAPRTCAIAGLLLELAPGCDPPQQQPLVGQWPPTSGGDALAMLDQRRARLRVEQVQLVEREVQRDDVARRDPVLGIDDPDDVLAADADVQQLVVAEVFDD